MPQKFFYLVKNKMYFSAFMCDVQAHSDFIFAERDDGMFEVVKNKYNNEKWVTYSFTDMLMYIVSLDPDIYLAKIKLMKEVGHVDKAIRELQAEAKRYHPYSDTFYQFWNMAGDK